MDQLLVLTVVGLLAGAVNAVAGGGSMISFPALVAMGVPPVTANVTNSVAALPGYLGGSLGYRAELAGQGPRIARLTLVSVAGAAAGALTLLAVSAEVFRAVVPWLVLASALMLVVQPRVAAWAARRRAGGPRRAALLSAQFAVAFYGGFFVAGLGIVMLATLGMLLDDTTQRLNALKGVLSLVGGPRPRSRSCSSPPWPGARRPCWPSPGWPVAGSGCWPLGASPRPRSAGRSPRGASPSPSLWR
jgi:uncharacterized membrane protein YfcA